jgi:multidrug resistance efflux pump
MESLPRIPSPASHLWREFRVKALPFLAFAAVVMVVGFLWQANLTAPMAEGEVEDLRVDVVTTADGVLTEVAVQRFDVVTNRQLVAVVEKTDADSLRTELAAARADLQLMRARMALDVERNAQNEVQLQIDRLTYRNELTDARIRLRQAEAELERTARLHKEKVVATGVGPDGQSGYEVALRDRDALKALVEDKARQVAELESSLQRLREQFPRPDATAKGDAVNAAIAAQEKRLELLAKPTELLSPMAGMVSAVNARPGSKVVAGTILATISATTSQRIIGYLRQPLAIEPRPGMRVEIRTRGPSRRVAQGEILKVGAEMQLVAAPLRVRGFNNAQERGLPFVVSLPPELNVRPGELVDLIIHAK